MAARDIGFGPGGDGLDQYEDGMPDDVETLAGLSGVQIDGFIRDGFVQLEAAFARETADEGRAILWRDLGCDPDDAATWTRPVVRLAQYAQAPFVRAANCSAPRMLRAESRSGASAAVPRTCSSAICS